MESQELLVRREGAVLTLTINREDKRNSLSTDVLEGICEQLRLGQDDPDLRVIVLTAVGTKAFCAGADLASGNAFKPDYSQPRNKSLPQLFRLARESNVPIVGRINGTCMAGGMGLLAICDMAIAADHALFGLPEVKVGVYPMQVLSVLQHVVPRRRLMEMCFTGEPVSAQEGLEMGLVNAVVPTAELDAAVQKMIDRIVDKSPTGIRRGKYATYAIEAMSFEESIKFMESQIALMSQTDDALEGRAAFKEKRKPVFTGR